MSSRFSIRLLPPQWSNDHLRHRVLSLVKGTERIREVAFFTSRTHQPLPLEEVRRRAAKLAEVISEFCAAGITAGINHLALMGHQTENVEHSLNEPWQHMVDIGGAVSPGCYCALDERHQAYVHESMKALAAAGPAFIWLDDDLRLESHGGEIAIGCFCELCLADFGRRTGRSWTRAQLAEALGSGSAADQLALRKAWLARNRAYFTDLLARARSAVDEVDPSIVLGHMTTSMWMSGMGFDAWAAALSGPGELDVKWRPGGGWYDDNVPLGCLTKAQDTGRQVAFVPERLRDIQYELENFPYQPLRKSTTMLQAEIAAAIGVGCTGAALNCLPLVPDPADECGRYLEAVDEASAFFDAAVATFGRSACEGVWVPATQDHQAGSGLGDDWRHGRLWGGELHEFNELIQIGLPMAYREAGASGVLLSKGVLGAFDDDELAAMLRGGAMCDGPALAALIERGLGDLAGFGVTGQRERDTIERFTDDALNGAYAGWHRDCRPSFWPNPCTLIEPAADTARVLAEVVDFAEASHGPCAGAYENAEGGRVVVAGYYPWQMVHSLAKSSQFKALARWLSRDRLPAYVSSFHKAALWCRRDGQGRPALMLINASIDAAAGLQVHVLGDFSGLSAMNLRGESVALARVGVDGPYSIFTLPALGPWQPCLVTVQAP